MVDGDRTQGADVNRMHGTLKPLHCACMVADVDCVELLLEKGAEVRNELLMMMFRAFEFEKELKLRQDRHICKRIDT